MGDTIILRRPTPPTNQMSNLPPNFLWCSESLSDHVMDSFASSSSNSMEVLNDPSTALEESEPSGETLGSTDSYSDLESLSGLSEEEIRLRAASLIKKPTLQRQDATVGVPDHSGEDTADPALQLVPGSQDLPLSISSEEDDLPPRPAAVAQPAVVLATQTATRAPFRLQAKFFFLTWPQCDTPKETVLERIKALPSYSHAVVSREDHKEEDGVHLHAFVAFSRVVNRRGSDWLDALAGKHGNYQSARDQQHVVKYVIKDGDYVADGFDPVQFLELRKKKKSSKESLASIVAQKVREEDASLDAIDDFAPAYVLTNKRKLQEYISYQKVKRAALAKLPWVPLDMSLFPDGDFNYKIAKWVSENVRQPREFKQKQLYIWSSGPNAGKTHLVNELSKYLTVYHVPKNGYLCGYESGRFDLCIIDEFKSDFTIQFLNEFLQGSTMHINQKNSSTLKEDNPPCIILANEPLAQIYHKRCTSNPFRALESRFKVVKVPDGRKIDLWKTLPLPQ